MNMSSKKTITLRVVLFLIICPLFLIIATPLTKDVPILDRALSVGVVTSLLTLVLTLLFVRWDKIGIRDAGVGFSRRTVPRVFFGFFIGMALVALEDSAIYSCGHAHWVVVASWPSLRIVLLTLAGYFAIALREELAFRGYSLRRMEAAWGLWPAIVVIGIFFTLEHAAGGWTWSRTMLGPPAGALLFGMAALATRGLAVPLGIHAAFNFGQWLMGQKGVPGQFRLVVEGGFEGRVEVVGYAAYIVGMVLAASAFWLWYKHVSGRDIPDVSFASR